MCLYICVYVLFLYVFVSVFMFGPVERVLKSSLLCQNSAPFPDTLGGLGHTLIMTSRCPPAVVDFFANFLWFC